MKEWTLLTTDALNDEKEEENEMKSGEDIKRYESEKGGRMEREDDPRKL